MKMFITSKNIYFSNDMKIFGICSIPLKRIIIYEWIEGFVKIIKTKIRKKDSPLPDLF